MFMDNNPLMYVLSTAKLNAVGHRWVGQLADFHFEIKYHPGKANTDADTLSCCPLNIDAFMEECSEELTEEAIGAVWEGSHRAQQKDVPWVAALNLTSQNHPTQGPLQAISHDELVREQREDSAIKRLLELKRGNAQPMEEYRNKSDLNTSRLLREWSWLNIENDI